jgi:hypothetical protein
MINIASRRHPTLGAKWSGRLRCGPRCGHQTDSLHSESATHLSLPKIPTVLACSGGWGTLSRNDRHIEVDRVCPRAAIQVAGAARSKVSCPPPSVDDLAPEGATQAASQLRRPSRCVRDLAPGSPAYPLSGGRIPSHGRMGCAADRRSLSPARDTACSATATPSMGTWSGQPLAVMGIRDRAITGRSPLQNGYSERLVGLIRRECVVTCWAKAICAKFSTLCQLPQPRTNSWAGR